MQIYNHIKEILEKNEKFCKDGRLFKNVVVEAALKLDPELLTILLEDEVAKRNFFTEVNQIAVFDKLKFQKFVSNKQFLPDSYTAFKNKIGLTANGEYLTEAKEVVLDFPYKDCVLEGGQTKEDQKRQEIFWNETLAPDEIDRLFEPKVLTNWKRYDKDGVHEVENISLDDNLIIKGNNLIALHSLKKVYKGKVKLIYIDPPYNTGNDSFQYNDSFNHSTWLTFMKNRLEIAREFLTDDGSIWINIDDKELAYLMVLCDEVFGKGNFINLTSIQRSAATGHKSINPSPISVTDYLIGYAKNKALWNYKKAYTKRGYDTAYNKFIINYDEDFDNWKFITVNEALEKLNIPNPDKLVSKYPNQVIRFAEPNYQGVGKETRNIIDKSKLEPDIVFRQVRENHLDIYIINGQRILFYKDKLKKIDGSLITAEPLTNFWDDIPFQGIANEGGVILKKGKKPEKLLKRIIEFSTNEKDIVLDYHLGSGTTAAVALKSNRRFIGIEQLDYGKNDSVKRLVNVLNGEQTGVSKVYKWDGGGSFVYAELKLNNKTRIEEIIKVTSEKDLKSIYKNLVQSEFVIYKMEQNKAKEQIVEFDKLDLDNKKKFLMNLLDKNFIYVSYSEMNDQENDIDIHSINNNHKFYNQ